MKVPLISFCFFVFFLILTSYSASAELFGGYANLSTTWTNVESLTVNSGYTVDNIIARPILYSSEQRFACGFLYNGTSMRSYHFAIFVVQIVPGNVSAEYSINYIISPEVVIWSANRDHEVRDGAILNFTATGELVLQDDDGSIVWTTNTRGKSVAGMNLTDSGNLVLFNVSGSVVWQSFDYPTDCLVPGQRLYQGQQLVSSVSSTDSTAQKGMYSLQVTDDGLVAYVGSNPPQIYGAYYFHRRKYTNERSYIRFLNGRLAVYLSYAEPDDPEFEIAIPQASPFQFIKLVPNGHLELIDRQSYQNWSVVLDILTNVHGECGYPLVCGRNGLCRGNQQCTCPTSDYFKPVNDYRPKLGCSEITPLTCDSKQDQDFIKLENVMYFTYLTYTPDMETLNMETCKQACLNSCSCKAALFRYHSNISKGYCYLPSELFSMINVDPSYNATAFIKVQKVRPVSLSPPSHQVSIVIGSTIGSFVLLVVVSVGFRMFVVRKRVKNAEREEEYLLDQIPGMPTRFSYEELKSATQNFSKKLGEGGFGTVFEGILEDGSEIAVKCLEGLTHIKKSFLAEVESIGSIHHVNLVRLRGFCAWKSQRLLVYEFMSNGSLDRWIYHGVREHVLEWECIKKIILDVAKGLAYLHEECRQKIIHLDIKPQNILLDSDFNAKVSDFGLSKLIDRNQKQVMTTMRGTPGYLAPEWLSSVITEKVDVYSFGIVLLEILCGRKNFDISQPEEKRHLLGMLQEIWEQGMLSDIVDGYSEDMKSRGTEVVEMMKLASWCLQTDYTRRPSMSSVVKVLEGVMNVESNLDYNFTDPRMKSTSATHEQELTLLMPSFLSGPR